MLQTRFYMCPNLSACVHTCAAGHSWDDRHAHLQELRGEAPHGEGNGPRKGLMLKGEGPGCSFNNGSSWEILGRSCDLRFIFFFICSMNSTLLPAHFETWSCFSKKLVCGVHVTVWRPCEPTGRTAFWRPQNIKRNILCKAAKRVNTSFYHSFVSIEAFMWNNLSDTIWNNPHQFH